MQPLLTAPTICAITARQQERAGEARKEVYHDNNNTPAPGAQRIINETCATLTVGTYSALAIFSARNATW